MTTLPTDFSNDTPSTDIHPAAHNDTNAAVNANTGAVAANTSAVAALNARNADDALASGMASYDRRLIVTNTAMVSGRMTVAFATCRKPFTATKVRVYSVGAAGATPTLIRFGLYRLETNDTLTLLGATANDTTVFAAANTAYTRNLTTPVDLLDGVRYGFAQLVVSTAAMPTILTSSNSSSAIQEFGDQKPWLGRNYLSLSDLPATASGGFSHVAAYMVALP